MKEIKIDEKRYRHAKFLQTLTLSESNLKLLKLFLKLRQVKTKEKDNDLVVDDHIFRKQEIIVEN